MELQFIYFNKFKKIEQLELNFSFKFNFKIKENKLEYTIRDNYIENFWGSQIKEIIAIVGNNGTGKSTILELIKTLCATDPQNPIRKGDSLENLEAIVVLYDRNLDAFYYFIEGTLNIEIPKEILKLELLDNNSPINLPKTQFLYYSNSFEYKDEYIYDSLLDISTINCLDKSKYDLPEDDDSDEISWELIKSQFRYSEIYRQLKLISNTEIKLPFETPKQISISINENESFFYPYEVTPDEKNDSNNSYLIISKFIEKYDYNKKTKDKNDSFSFFFYTLLKVALINYVKEKSSESSNGIYTYSYKILPDEIAKYIESLKGENLKTDFISFFDSFHKTKSFYFNGEELYNTLYDLAVLLNKKGKIINNLSASITLKDDNKDEIIVSLLS